MEKVKILGIGGGRIGGNTEILVKEALKAAEVLGNIETEFISLWGKNIHHCVGDYRCYLEGTSARPCIQYDDDMKTIYPKMLESDGLILGSPVYYASVTGHVKNFMDRTLCIGTSVYTENRGIMCQQVGGAIATGWDKHGGVETTLQTILAYFLVHNMIIVGGGIAKPSGSYLGGGMYTYPTGQIETLKQSKDLMIDVGWGIKSARTVGVRVAEVAKVAKAGYAALMSEEEKRVESWMKEKAKTAGSVRLDWNKWFSLCRMLPVEQIGIRKFVCAKGCFEKFVENASKGGTVEQYKKGLAWGTRPLDGEKIRKAMLQTYKLGLVDDDVFYRLNPEFYEYYRTK